MEIPLQSAFTDFAIRSLRDVADGDYIAARACYRIGLEEQFLWLGLQSLEKYMKAVIFLNDGSIRKFRHELTKLYRRMLRIPRINFDIPKDVVKFLDYLDLQGPNRYFEVPSFTTGRELFLLDKAVWHIRRYCQFIARDIEVIDGRNVDWLKVTLASIHNPLYSQKPTKFQLAGGRLEHLLKQSRSKLREILVWKNFYYGRYTKQVIKNFTFRSGSAYPTHFLHPEIFEQLATRVYFPPRVKQQLQKWLPHERKRGDKR